MATRTGRLVLDRKTGKMVEEVKEDQMAVALFDKECERPEDHKFQFVLRSDFTLAKINLLFNCNAALLKDPFGNVLWPKDWMTQVLPPKGSDRWFYIIHERLEPLPRDDLADPLYSGGSAIMLSGVPIQCEEIDLKMWLLFGVAQDFVPLKRVKSDIELSRKKKLLLKQKLDGLPTMDIEGSPEQQAETRKKLADAIEGHATRYDEELAALSRRKARIERLLFTEPLNLAIIPEETDRYGTSGVKPTDSDQKLVETRTWVVQFTSSRGVELATVAMAKCDWNYVCLAQVRPTPLAFLEDDQVEGNDGAISARYLDKEINMRTVRLKRLRHGNGELLTANLPEEVEQDAKQAVDPSADDFHFSSLGSLYSGEFQLGEKHGRGREVTNIGVYEGEFVRDMKHGSGKMVYGKGTTCWGTFAPAATRKFEYGKKAKGKECTSSLLNGDDFRGGAEHGERMHIQFPDGATYDGEMTDGRICGFGRYVSSTGVVDEGTFVDGVLHGSSCRREYPSGAVEAGNFVNGELHGQGHGRDKHGDEFDGFFEHGARHGRGRSTFLSGKCKHVGFWRENAMDGRGDFLYVDRSVLQSTIGDLKASSTKVAEDSISSNNKESETEEENSINGEGFLGGGKWRYWYEGGFLHGETRARHRHVDLAFEITADESQKYTRACNGNRRGFSPFTTNAKSATAMPFLASELPTLLAKTDRRNRANTKRRIGREREFLEKKERDNLVLYYALLDGFYEKWTARKKFARRISEMNDENERRRALQEQKAQDEFEKEREKRRKEKYDLSPHKQDLFKFESYLERITLTEHVQLQRAAAAEGFGKPPQS